MKLKLCLKKIVCLFLVFAAFSVYASSGAGAVSLFREYGGESYDSHNENPADGQEQEDEDDIQSLLGEQYEASGADRLYDALPLEVRLSLSRAGIDISGAGDWDTIDAGQLVSVLSEMLSGAAASPLRACAAALAVIMICAMLGGVYDPSGTGTYRSVLTATVTAASCCVLVTPAAVHISACSEALLSLDTFTQALVPVLCAVTLAAGGISEAGCFSSLTVPAAGMISLAVNGKLIGMLRIFLALSCVSPLSGLLSLNGFIEIMEKNIKWLLTLTATVFLGVLAAGCSAAAAYDSVKHKAFKLIVSGSVPVIGGPVSDALASIYSCIGMLKASVGSFAFLAVLYILLPPVIRTALWKLALELCAAAAGLFDVKPAEKMLRSCAAAMNIMLSFLVFSAVIILGSIAVAMRGTGA